MKKLLVLIMVMIVALSIVARAAVPPLQPAPAPPPAPERSPTLPAPEYAFIANLRTALFHRTTCYSIPEPHNRVYFATREEALSAGNNACRRCKP